MFFLLLFLKKLYIKMYSLKGSISSSSVSPVPSTAEITYLCNSCSKRGLVGPLTQCWNPAVHCLPHSSKRSPPFLHSLKMASKRYVCIKKKVWFFSFHALCIHILDSARIQLKTPTDFILIYKCFHLQQVHQARSSCLNPTE